MPFAEISERKKSALSLLFLNLLFLLFLLSGSIKTDCPESLNHKNEGIPTNMAHKRNQGDNSDNNYQLPFSE